MSRARRERELAGTRFGVVCGEVAASQGESLVGEKKLGALRI